MVTSTGKWAEWGWDAVDCNILYGSYCVKKNLKGSNFVGKTWKECLASETCKNDLKIQNETALGYKLMGYVPVVRCLIGFLNITSGILIAVKERDYPLSSRMILRGSMEMTGYWKVLIIADLAVTIFRKYSPLVGTKKPAAVSG